MSMFQVFYGEVSVLRKNTALMTNSYFLARVYVPGSKICLGSARSHAYTSNIDGTYFFYDQDKEWQFPRDQWPQWNQKKLEVKDRLIKEALAQARKNLPAIQQFQIPENDAYEFKVGSYLGCEYCRLDFPGELNRKD